MRYLRDKAGHLICVPYSIEGLHRMARLFNLGRHYFHKGRLPHYDMPKMPTERVRFIEKHTTLVSSKVIVEYIRRIYVPKEL